MDDECPKEKAFALTQRILAIEVLPFSVVVVCAKREYESWFLASLETIHPGQFYEKDPEGIRDAKGWLRKHYGYKPTQDQARYTQKINFELARSRSRSFQRLIHAFEELYESTRNGSRIVTPDPTPR